MGYGDSLGNHPGSWDYGKANNRDAKNDMPGMQPHTEKQNRSMLERDIQGGRCAVALLALREQGRGMVQ